MKTLVFDRLVLGDTRREVLQYVAEQHTSKKLKWPTKEGPSVRTVDDYIAKASAELKQLSTVQREDAMAAARARFVLLIRTAYDKGDLSTARLATRDLARIDGLEPLRVQHSGSVLTEHTGTVSHVHDHTHRAVTVDEQVDRIRGLFQLADSRRVAAGGSSS